MDNLNICLTYPKRKVKLPSCSFSLVRSCFLCYKFLVQIHVWLFVGIIVSFLVLIFLCSNLLVAYLWFSNSFFLILLQWRINSCCNIFLVQKCTLTGGTFTTSPPLVSISYMMQVETEEIIYSLAGWTCKNMLYWFSCLNLTVLTYELLSGQIMLSL